MADLFKNSVFPTSVNLESRGGRRPKSQPKLASRLGASIDQESPVELNDTERPLPSSIPVPQIVESLTEDAPFSRKGFWRRQMRRPCMLSLARQLFWLVVACYFQNQVFSTSHGLFDHAATQYVNCILAVPREKLQRLMAQLRDMLCGVLLLSLPLAYPRDAALFEDRDFRSKLYDLVSWLFAGRRDTRPLASDHWLHTATDALRFRKKGLLGIDKAGLIQMSLLSAGHAKFEQSRAKPEVDSGTLKQIYDLSFSPLIDHFLRKNRAMSLHKALHVRVAITETVSRPVIGGLDRFRVVEMAEGSEALDVVRRSTGHTHGTTKFWGRGLDGRPTKSARAVAQAAEKRHDWMLQNHEKSIIKIGNECDALRETYENSLDEIQKEFLSVKKSGKLHEFAEHLLTKMRIPRAPKEGRRRSRAKIQA
eukprot:scaffold343_cov245-Pinguiococcus_pyrenoidosus.AAC.18